MTVRPDIQVLQKEMAKYIIGQADILDHILVAVLSNGNLLVEGLPGLAKTRAIRALADNIEADFGRIQFTPDLSSSDITGKMVAIEEEGTDKTVLKFERGPIFNNIVLADEVNRAPSRTQNAMLEAMEERQVTVGGQTFKMPKLFMVMATMNPTDQDGVFPLPEAQKDRFLMHASVDYPTEESEMKIIKMVRDEEKQKKKKKEKTPPLKQETLFKARGEIDSIKVPEHVLKYMVDFIFVTRYPERIDFELKSYISVGASPRASLAIDRTSRAFAWLKGEKEVTIEHVQHMVKPVLRHRLMHTDRAKKHKIHSDELIQDIIDKLEVPKKA